MRLYIAEKPSMGREIANCLRKPYDKSNDGYIATGDGVVTWLIGHVLRQAEPDEYNDKYKFWNVNDLPIIPEKWKMVVDKNAAKQFKIVRSLIKEADEIIHAGDPDREGQLLVDEVLDYVGNKKPVKRILLNALDEQSIKAANSDLKDNKDFFNLKQSALARARADWLIGMNLSRAYTLAARRAGYSRLVFPIGRVKTPTLALVVRREREIENFKPVDYYLIRADFKHKNGIFTAQWKPNKKLISASNPTFDEKSEKISDTAFDKNNRLINKSVADEMIEFFKLKPHDGTITLYETKLKKEPPPLPFSLSALQVMLGKCLGYEPQKVLETAQSLYEKKLTTYPRSDCSYLPPSQHGDAAIILNNLKVVRNDKFLSYLSKTDVKKRSRAWNKSKITAHHAIIPTTKPVDLTKLTEVEKNTYLFIARQYIAQFMEDFVYDETTVNVNYKDELFAAKGKVIKQLGWREMYMNQPQKADDDEIESILPYMQEGDSVEFKKANLLQKTTKPPLRFTPSTLIQGMKDIHKYVKSPEAKKQLKDVYGIGTEATRAAIIDDLIKREFLKTIDKKKSLQPTPRAYILIDALPDSMTYPDETAVWEDKLHSMSEGEGTLEDFLNGQINFTRELCNSARVCKIKENTPAVDIEINIKESNKQTKKIPQNSKSIACPKCKTGQLIRRASQRGFFWGCSNYPDCLMTCNDTNGKPDMQNAKYKLKYYDIKYGKQEAK